MISEEERAHRYAKLIVESNILGRPADICDCWYEDGPHYCYCGAKKEQRLRREWKEMKRGHWWREWKANVDEHG